MDLELMINSFPKLLLHSNACRIDILANQLYDVLSKSSFAGNNTPTALFLKSIYLVSIKRSNVTNSSLLSTTPIYGASILFN